MKKIPDHAQKVFDGILFDVYHWEQEMFDGSEQLFEAIKKRDSVTVIAVYENKIAIDQEEQPGRQLFTTLPGGVCKPNITTLENAKRELREETGLVSEDWSLWFISDPFHSTKIEWDNYFYIARNCSKIGEPMLDPGEKIQTSFISFDEFLELRNNPRGRNRDLFTILETASKHEDERKKLQDMLGITN